MTVRDLITRALKTGNCIAQGETPSAGDINDAFDIFNEMLGTWQNESLMVWDTDRTVFVFVANQSVYTIGPTASTPDWTWSVRPPFIYRAGVQQGTGTSQVEIPLEMIDDAEYAQLRVKPVTSTYPQKVIYHRMYPLGELIFWPVPTDVTVSAVLYLPVVLTVAANLDVVLSLPPGYEEAIRYNLAVRYAPTWGRMLDPTVAGLAVESKSAIKRANLRAEVLHCDPAVCSTEPGAWNIFTGGQ